MRRPATAGPTATCLATGLVLVVVAACGPGPAPDAHSAGELVAIPEPDLSRLEPAVAEQLADRRRVIAAAEALAATDPARAAERFGDSGELYLAYGLRQAAAACLTNASRLAPETLRWHYYRGVNAREADDAATAREALGRTLELDPGYQPAAVALAEMGIAEGRYDEAIATVEATLRRAPDSPALLAALGRAELAAGDPEAAAGHLERALDLAPEAGELRYPLGLALRRLGREAEARELLARPATGEAPLPDPLLDELAARERGARLLNQRGNVEFRSGDPARAAETFRQAVAADPDDPEARHNLAAALVRLGRRDDAADELAELLRRRPDFYLGHFTLGTLRAQQGRDAEAVEHYRRALALYPDHRDSHFNLANALRRLGRWQEAEEHYRRAAELDPGSPQAHFGHALSLMQLGRWRQARQRLEEAHRALPGDAVLADALARLLASAPQPQVRDGERALALARELFAAAPSAVHAETLAMALAATGRFEEAARRQEAALATARAAGDQGLTARLAAGLERYRSGRPAELPE